MYKILDKTFIEEMQKEKKKKGAIITFITRWKAICASSLFHKLTFILFFLALILILQTSVPSVFGISTLYGKYQEKISQSFQMQFNKEKNTTALSEIQSNINRIDTLQMPENIAAMQKNLVYTGLSFERISSILNSIVKELIPHNSTANIFTFDTLIFDVKEKKVHITGKIDNDLYAKTKEESGYSLLSSYVLQANKLPYFKDASIIDAFIDEKKNNNLLFTLDLFLQAEGEQDPADDRESFLEYVDEKLNSKVKRE